MLRIPCPWCGIRDEPEFSFGGQSHLARPAFDASDADWCEYLYTRENPKGTHFERWRHTFGCGQWFNIARHTVSHEVLAVYRMGEGKPDVADVAHDYALPKAKESINE